MVRGLEALSSRSYPGRIIIIGKDLTDENVVVIYAITGRSSSSQARKIVFEGNHAWVKPTDEDVVKKGDVNLLIYSAITISGGIVVSNGKQTDDISARLGFSKIPQDVLKDALSSWDYEPDPPTYTPRISGCVLSSNEAALSIIRRAADGSSLRNFYAFPLIPGQGKMIATYAGENKDPLPSFASDPAVVEIQTLTAKETVEGVYTTIGPDIPGQDFRVAAACVFARDLESDDFMTAVINRHERKD
jgi:IMP cyclohydrolase